LISDDPKAEMLRTNFVIKVVPMMNPDGVIVGNYRCNINGWDLNRKWGTPDKEDHPEIVAIKEVRSFFFFFLRAEFLKARFSGKDGENKGEKILHSLHPHLKMTLSFQTAREVSMFCDFHGHSRKHDVFLYGCHNNNNEAKR
jgi:predicted deacylase